MDTTLNYQNFSVSDKVYHRPVEDFEARLTQVGFNYSKNESEQFHWSLSNIYTGEEIISTKNRKLII